MTFADPDCLLNNFPDDINENQSLIAINMNLSLSKKKKK